MGCRGNFRAGLGQLPQDEHDAATLANASGLRCVSEASKPANGRSVLEIPGFLEAVQREQFVRDAAFLRLSESVAGFELVPLTLRHYLILRATRNPLLWGGLPSPNQLFNFLWMLAPLKSEISNLRS